MLRYRHDPPWQSLGGRAFIYERFSCLNLALQHVVSALYDIFRIWGIHSLQGGPSVGDVQVHSGIVKKVRFGKAEFYSAGPVNRKRKEGKPGSIPAAGREMHVIIFERIVELLFERPFSTHIWHPHGPVACKAELCGFRRDGHRLVSNEAVCHAVVIGAEDNVEIFRAEFKLVETVADSCAFEVLSWNSLGYAATLRLAYGNLPAVNGPVSKSKGYFGWFNQTYTIAGQRPADTVAGAYSECYTAVRGF